MSESPLKCTRLFVQEWRVRAIYSEHIKQEDLDAADDVLHDAEIAHEILARAELAEAERDAALRSLEAITEQIAAVRADAERYRWLRTVRRCHPVFVIRADDARGDTMLFYDQLDAAIDAAMKEPPA